MPDSIFTRIINGEIPSHKIYEDDHIFAFLDVGPLSNGHALVVPKEPAATLDTLSDDAAAAIGPTLPRLCRAVTRATGCPCYNVLVNTGKLAGQLVDHVHFHIIPKPDPSAPGPDGLIMQWNASEIDHDEAAALASDIAAALSD